MEEQGLNSELKRTQRDYNLAFKLSVIEEVESKTWLLAQADKIKY